MIRNEVRKWNGRDVQVQYWEYGDSLVQMVECTVRLTMDNLDTCGRATAASEAEAFVLASAALDRNIVDNANGNYVRVIEEVLFKQKREMAAAEWLVRTFNIKQ